MFNGGEYQTIVDDLDDDIPDFELSDMEEDEDEKISFSSEIEDSLFPTAQPVAVVEGSGFAREDDADGDAEFISSQTSAASNKSSSCKSNNIVSPQQPLVPLPCPKSAMKSDSDDYVSSDEDADSNDDHIPRASSSSTRHRNYPRNKSSNNQVAQQKTTVELFLEADATRKKHYRSFWMCPCPGKYKACKNRQKRKEDFVKHLRVHTDERPFSCDKCNYASKTAGALQAHKRTHTGVKPFQCGVCGKKFSQDNNMKRHEKIHKKIV